MTDTPEQERINAGLKRIRTFRKSLGVIVLGFIPVVYLLYLLELDEWLFMSLGVAWVCLGVVIELVIGFSRCPACRGYFHVRGMTGNIFARKCMNCGVPLKPQV
ncbi:MAG: hypothetical protein FD174_1989 [Geobacteraceae bacterium]|nr:MAG: hypothetical protein FD174_1989 [Geobacteraceae bacterium]